MMTILDTVLYYTFWCFIHLDLLSSALIILGTFFVFFKRKAKFGKKLLLAGIIPFVITNFSPLGPAMILHLETMIPRPSELPKDVDGLILLGGCFSLVETRDRGEPVYNKSGTRIFQFIALAAHYPKAKIILTGTALEVKWSTDILTKHGISKERITTEDLSQKTLDHAAYLKSIIDPQKPYILATSAFHLPRSYAHFMREGYTSLIPYALDYHTPGHMSKDFWLTSIITRITPMAYKQGCVEWAGLIRAYIIKGGAFLPKVG